MGTLVLAAAVQGAFIAFFSLSWPWLRRRLYVRAEASWQLPPAVIIAVASVVSVALYTVLHYDQLSAWHDSHILYDYDVSFVERFLSTPHFRNAISGAVIAVLAYLWLEQRKRYHEQPYVRSLSKLLRLAELNLVLLVVITFVAVILAELPGILRAYKITFGSEGVSLHFKETDELGSVSVADQGGKPASIGPGRLTPLDWLQISVSRPARDAAYVCHLAQQEPNENTEGECDAARLVRDYNEAALQTTIPVLECLANLMIPLRNQGLFDSLIRPTATAYMHAVFAWEAANTDPDAKYHSLSKLTNALIRFGERLPDYGSLAEGESCRRARAVAEDLRDFTEEVRDPQKFDRPSALYRVMEFDRVLPYGHINHAIFSMLLGDARDGILVLQQWQNTSAQRRNDLVAEARFSEQASAWTGFIARYYQNAWISNLPDDMLAPTDKRRLHVHESGAGALDILETFTPSFLRDLHDTHYCTDDINAPLMVIYYQHLYGIQMDLYHLFRSHDQEILSAFDEQDVHLLAGQLSGSERLKQCFIEILGPSRALLHEAFVNEVLGDYKFGYAAYVERWARDAFPDFMPEELRKQAVKHFELALGRIDEARKEEERKEPKDPPARMDVLVKLLVKGDAENEGIVRIRNKLAAAVRSVNR